MKEETTMKWGGFIVNSRPYQFFSKERAFINRLLKGNGITRRRGFGILFNLTKVVVKEGWEQQKGKVVYGGTFRTKTSKRT